MKHMNSAENNLAMKKILLIDPWGIGGTGEYTNGLIYGLSKQTELTVITNAFFEKKTNGKCNINKWFFKRSEKMNSSKVRSFIRGIEYMITYIRICRYLKKHEFDVVHINWLLMYRLDSIFLPIIKKRTKKLVYTAHNVLPHVKNKDDIRKIRKIYEIVDKIILHGTHIKDEFSNYFPELIDKIYIQKHGCNINPKTEYDLELIGNEIIEKVKSFDRRYIFFGNIFYNKGVDILIEIWLKKYINENALLIVAGKTREDYPQLFSMKEKIESCNNILFLNYIVEDNLLNYLIDNSNLIILPYRHASMSGVVFTAADFGKPVLCTSTGALKEYLHNGEDSIIVDNIELIENKLQIVHNNYDDSTLDIMGKALQKNIKRDCSWEVITKELVDVCY